MLLPRFKKTRQRNNGLEDKGQRAKIRGCMKWIMYNEEGNMRMHSTSEGHARSISISICARRREEDEMMEDQEGTSSSRQEQHG